MNKDVIYIEPDDDITDIISKIESAKEKIVALVPPKKSGVLRSVVNIKLITKACAAEKKNVVLVTTDPSILKLAASVKIPVTKNLQTAPAIPTEADVEETATEEVVEDDIKVNDGTAAEEDEDEPEEEEEEEEEEKEEEKEETEKDDKAEETEEEKTEKAEKKKTDSAIKELAAEAKAEEKAKKKAEKEANKKDKKKSDNPVIAWISTYKKWVIGGSIALVLAILFLIWALVIAPAVKISVVVRTDSNNFSELVSFTSDPASENAAEGIFYLEEIKLSEEQKTEFTATGTKNIGDKASGEIIVQASFRKGETLSVNAGSVFKAGGLTFYSDSDITLAWSGNDFSECDNKNRPSEIMAHGCIRSTRITVTAAAPGEAYNIDKTSFVAPNDRISAYSEAAFTGGTDKTVTIVSKENVESAKAKIVNNNKENEQATKDALYAKIGEGKIPIESSFKQSVSDPVSTPNIDEEVKDTTIPSVVVTTTTAIYVLDQTKLEEFISAKAKLAEDQKIYAINNPFVESFVATESGYAGKLKTTYYTGPKITENDIIELVKGKGVGDIRHDLGSVNGVSKISIDPSFPWVTSAPNDSNKITVELTIEDKNNSKE